MQAMQKNARCRRFTGGGMLDFVQIKYLRFDEALLRKNEAMQTGEKVKLHLCGSLIFFAIRRTFYKIALHV